MLENVLNKLGDIGVNAGMKLLYAIIVLVVGLKLVKFAMRLLKKSRLFNKMDKSLASFLLSFVKIALYILLGVTIASMLGVPLTSMITVLGSAGLAIGLALQGGLSNIAGGIIILLFKPFKVGDFIDTHADSGTVKGISLFYTTLVTPDNKVISIPNGNLANQATVNYSKETTRRLDIDVSVSYKNDINEVKKILNGILSKEKRLVKDKDVFVVRGEKVEKLFKMTNFTTEEAFVRFSKKLRHMGLDDELEKMGIQEGDIVRIMDYEFEYTK